MIRIGILSDTHLPGPNTWFQQQVQVCFSDVAIILHAGDLTDISVLDAFQGKEVHAVHGNMCSHNAYTRLPAKKTIQVGGFTIGLAHGDASIFYNPEEWLWNELAPADCIVYGHTHRPVCHRAGPVLFVNPGSFSQRFGRSAPGTYAILEVGSNLHATIHALGPLT